MDIGKRINPCSILPHPLRPDSKCSIPSINQIGGICLTVYPKIWFIIMKVWIGPEGRFILMMVGMGRFLEKINLNKDRLEIVIHDYTCPVLFYSAPLFPTLLCPTILFIIPCKQEINMYSKLTLVIACVRAWSGFGRGVVSVSQSTNIR